MIAVTDPFCLERDPAMAVALGALKPALAARRLAEALPPALKVFELHAISVTRHKRGRRCLIEYDLQTGQGALTVIGKVRTKGLDKRYGLQCELWNNGFSEVEPGSVCIPEPLGTVPAFHMTLQRKVAGVLATDYLRHTPAAAERIAEAITRLQRSGLKVQRCHTVADELAILEKQLKGVIEIHPELSSRLDAVFLSAASLAARLPDSEPSCLHRDFYPDQVLITDSHLYLLDLDLVCKGDPALDAGNFLAHLTEQALREHGDPRYYKAQEGAFEGMYRNLNPKVSQEAIEIYYTLTVARHIAISRRIPNRRHLTPEILRLSEALLGCA